MTELWHRYEAAYEAFRLNVNHPDEWESNAQTFEALTAARQAILDEGLKEYQALLRSIEWEGRAADEPSCPRCNGLMPDSVYGYAPSAVSMYGIGHRSDCDLNAMLMPANRPCRTCSRPEWEHRASSEPLADEVAAKIAAMSDADYSAMVTDHPFRAALAAVRESQVSEGGV